MKVKKAPEDTPLLKQFFSVKAQHPEAILLYRVGDFYETYSDDSLIASKVLGIVLTKRSNGDKEAVPMAGFPHHALETYLPRLVKAGYKVAVCDQLEDPRLAGRKLVKRGVTELVTPGIAFNEQLLEQKQHNFLAGICIDKDRYGVAFLDVSTGTFQVAQGSQAYISTLLSTIGPKELVATRSDRKAISDAFGDEWYISTLDEWAFVYDSCVDKLCRQFGVESLKGFAIDCFPLGVCAAGALLTYLEQTRHNDLKNICSISRIDEDRFVWMDRFTFRNLEVFAPAAADGKALIDVMDHCSCAMGARLLRSWLSMPIMDTAELSRRYDIVEHFTLHPDALEQLQATIGSMGDLERIISRAAAGKIGPRETLQLGRGLGLLAPMKEICDGSGVAPLQALVDALCDCGGLVKAISTTISPECASAIGKGDVIAPGVNSELDHLRSIAHGGREYLLEMQKRESEHSGIPSLKISYNNVFGYYIEVRNTHKDKVPPEWIRKQTLVNAERYITEELKEYENTILGAEEKIYQLEQSIYAALVGQIQASISAIQANAAVISRIDVLSGFADLALGRGYCRPVVDEGRSIDIKEGRHPVIETLMKPGEEYVPNDIHLDSEGQQIMILTGPNMAGKSALLRQTALIVLMAQTGCFVPARQAAIGYCDKIFTRVGASDNISRGESTFMVEMLETAMILHNLSARSLVLLDEIGRGTSTYDGMSIARSIVEYIHEHGCGAKTLFATHYHELNDLERLYPRVHNFHIEVKEKGKQVIFLRKLREGGTAHSFGIHVARMAGMPKEVIEAAERTLSNLERGQMPQMSVVRKEVEAPVAETDEAPILEGMQLSLFQLDDPTLSSMRATLEAVDLDNLTPLQAFDLIRSLRRELGLNG